MDTAQTFFLKLNAALMHRSGSARTRLPFRASSPALGAIVTRNVERRFGNGDRIHFRFRSVKVHPRHCSSFSAPRSSIRRSGNFGDYAGAAAVSIRRSSAAATHFNAKGQCGGVAEHAIVVVVTNSR